MKIQKQNWGGGSQGGRVGGQGRCEHRGEVFVKILKKNIFWGEGVGGVGLRGVRVDVNEDLKFWRKFKKKRGGVVGQVGVGLVVVGGGGFRLDVDAMLGGSV